MKKCCSVGRSRSGRLYFGTCEPAPAPHTPPPNTHTAQLDTKRDTKRHKNEHSQTKNQKQLEPTISSIAITNEPKKKHKNVTRQSTKMTKQHDTDTTRPPPPPPPRPPPADKSDFGLFFFLKKNNTRNSQHNQTTTTTTTTRHDTTRPSPPPPRPPHDISA